MSHWSRITGEGPVVVIAEAGVNHDGLPDDAHALVELAARSGADVVKFQTFRVDSAVSPEAPTAAYQVANTGQRRQFEMLSELVLPDSIWPELAEHARSRGLGFVSTPFDLESAEMLAAIGIEFVKVPSGELTNLPFLGRLSLIFKHMLVSTGMASMDEVGVAVEALEDQVDLALLHCISAYPAPMDQLNLRAISTLRQRFSLPVGWSDHSLSGDSAVMAVALGASVVEKHITLDRGRPGPDHKASSDEIEMTQFVRGIRNAEKMLGSGAKEVQPCELDAREVSRRSWHVRDRLDRGHTLREIDIVALRPGSGISPSESIVGRRLAVSVDRGTLLTPEMLDD